MKELENTEITRDNLVSRLLWFALGFLFATILAYLFLKHKL
jgi:hypothetical protein